jgi:hypothetical protein
MSYNNLKILSSTKSHLKKPSLSISLSKEQQVQIKACVQLIELLINHLTTKTCINHVVLCLCELLDLWTWHNSNQLQNTAQQQQKDPTIGQIYDVR